MKAPKSDAMHTTQRPASGGSDHGCAVPDHRPRTRHTQRCISPDSRTHENQQRTPFQPVAEEEVAVGIEVADVAGAEPAPGQQRFRSRFGKVPVAAHEAGGARLLLAGLTHRDSFAGVDVDVAQRHPRPGATAGAQSAERDCAGRAFGIEAVVLGFEDAEHKDLTG